MPKTGPPHGVQALTLTLALGCWRRKVRNAGVDFQDGMRTLLDLRFADDIFLFVKTFEETKFLLDELMTCLAEVGLQWTTEIFYSSSWENMVCCMPGTILDSCEWFRSSDAIILNRFWIAPMCILHGNVFCCLTPFYTDVVWLELLYWAASRPVPCMYRRFRMCKETRPSPSPVLLRFERGLGWRLWGAGPSASTSLVKHGERCERWVCVCEGAWRRREIQASWPHKLSSLRG